MIGEMYYKLKSLVRPVTQHRRLLERAKYLGTRILSAQEGNDYLARSIPQTAATGKIGNVHNVRVRQTPAGLVVHFHCLAPADTDVAAVGARMHGNAVSPVG